jgi:predicted ferric reductase
MLRRFSRKGPVLVGLYLLLAVVPLPLAAVGASAPGRGFWIEFGVGLGFIALSMMGIQFALTARFQSLSSRFGQDVLLQFHRQVGLIAALLVVAHPAVLIAAEPGFAAFFDPRVNAARAVALVAALAALAGVIFLSLFRVRCALRYEWWRLTHGLMAMMVVFVGLVHTYRVGHYVSGWKVVPFALLILAPLALLLHVRLIRPLRMRKFPYRVAGVRNEIDRVWTVVVVPAAGRGLSFRAGQFAWLTIADSPLDLQQHPFTIASSSEHPERIEFTIKELGDYTATIGSIPVGAAVYLDGPAGSFTLSTRAAGAVLICGGIGITPAMSIIRTMRDRRDPRPLTLLYAVGSLERATFRDELDGLATEMPLRVVYVPERPPEHWDGPRGFIDGDMLRALLDAPALERHEFMICGPEPMMDGVERALLGLGVDRDRIRSERFNVI